VIDVTAMLRRALVLWPDVTITRTAPMNLKNHKLCRFSWDVFVTVYGDKKSTRSHFRARSLPEALTRAIDAGELKKSRATWRSKKKRTT